MVTPGVEMSRHDDFEGSYKSEEISGIVLDRVLRGAETSAENSIIYNKRVIANMGKSEQNSTFKSGDLLHKSIINARVNTHKIITMVDFVESNNILENRSVGDNDIGGATDNMHPLKDMVVSQLRNDHGNDPQRSPLHDQESENEEKLFEGTRTVDELRRLPLKRPIVDEITFHTPSPVTVCLVERITQRHSAGDTHTSSSSMTHIASENEKSGKTVDVESELIEKRMDEMKDVDGDVMARNDRSGEESTVTSQDVSVDSDVMSLRDAVGRSSNNVIDTQSGDALQTSSSSSNEMSVTNMDCSVSVIKSPDTQNASVSSCAGDTVGTKSDMIDMSPTSDSLSVPQGGMAGGDSITDSTSDDVNALPNYDGDKNSTVCINSEGFNIESVTNKNVTIESVSVNSINTASINLSKDTHHGHLSQNVSVSLQSDTVDAVSCRITETASCVSSAAPLCTSDTGDATVMHVIAPICNPPVSLPAVTVPCTNVITIVTPTNSGMSKTVARRVTSPVTNVASGDVTGHLVRPAGNIFDEGSNCQCVPTKDQHGLDLIISSSKITKRKYVGPETVVIKREKLDSSYDRATAGSKGQVSRGQCQVNKSQGQVSRGKIQVVTRPVTVNPMRAPHLARHLMQGTANKESLSKLGRPSVRTVTLQVLPPGGRGTAVAGGDTPRMVYPANLMWKHMQSAGSKSETCVIMAPSVGNISLNSAPPFTTVSRPYMFVSSSTSSISQSQFVQAQPKLQTVTIVPASSAPSRARMRQVSVSSVNGKVNKALSRPDSVPTYNCPAPPTGLFDEPPQSYSCSECHDTFWHKRSLRQHLDRMSVSIRIHCASCKTQLLFYNHCAFLLHMRSHRPGSLDAFGLHRAKVGPLPQHFMPTVCSNDPGSSPASIMAHTADSTTLVSHASVTPQLVQHAARDCIEKSSTTKTRFVCTECHLTFMSQGQLQHHLALKVGQKLYHCDRCTMVMRNPCRYRAHVRIHMKQRPYVCPECGDVIHGDHAVFLKHVKWRCLHFTRTVRFTCTHDCNSHFDTESTYINHVVVKHASSYYKCLSCPMAFRADGTFQKHNMSIHTSTAVSQHIIKCSYCDTVYQRHAELTAHMATSHQAELWGLMHYVFKCPQCKHVRATKYDLIKHMETTHAFKYMVSMCNVCGEEMAGRLLAAHKSECHPNISTKQEPFMWQCNLCPQSFFSAARLLKHRRVHNGNARGVSLIHLSRDEDKSSDEANNETNCEYVEPTLEFSCTVCSGNFSEHSELTRHLRAEHGIIPQFPCHLCGLTYENEADTKRHIMDVHDGKKAVVPPSFTCWLCIDDDDVSRHFKKRRGLVNHLVTVHRIPKNNINLARLSLSLSDSSGAEGATEAISPVVKRLKTDSDSKFVCVKCDFSGDDRATFVEHIAKHRTRDNPWQCHECALCFTVRPSLRRHLFMVHRVRDFVRYNKEAGVDLDVPLVDMKEEEDDELMFGTFVRPTLPPPALTGVSPVSDNPLECTVCYKQFDDENVKRVHMRTHGMAFIYSRRRATKPVQ